MEMNGAMKEGQHNSKPDQNVHGSGLQPRCGKVLDVEALFAETREVRLIYRSAEYRLRLTRNSKLILTK